MSCRTPFGSNTLVWTPFSSRQTRISLENVMFSGDFLLLTEQIVALFDSENTNPKNAQLIFTTHNTNLLDLDILRRDQIWFTEKDGQTAVSTLFSLDDYSIRKDAKVEKKYLLGRFGAIPVFRGGLL